MNFNEFYRILNWFFQFNSNKTIFKNSQKYWKSIWKKKTFRTSISLNFLFPLKIKIKSTQVEIEKKEKNDSVANRLAVVHHAHRCRCRPFRASGADCQSIEWPIQNGHQSPAIDWVFSDSPFIGRTIHLDPTLNLDFNFQLEKKKKN